MNKSVFDYLKSQQEEDFNELEYPGQHEPDNENDEGIYGYLEKNSYEAQMPYILMGELEFWGE